MYPGPTESSTSEAALAVSIEIRLRSSSVGLRRPSCALFEAQRCRDLSRIVHRDKRADRTSASQVTRNLIGGVFLSCQDVLHYRKHLAVFRDFCLQSESVAVIGFRRRGQRLALPYSGT